MSSAELLPAEEFGHGLLCAGGPAMPGWTIPRLLIDGSAIVPNAGCRIMAENDCTPHDRGGERPSHAQGSRALHPCCQSGCDTRPAQVADEEREGSHYERPCPSGWHSRRHDTVTHRRAVPAI